MKVEDQLRELLADDRYAVAAWPDPVDRVVRGVDRRRRRRRAVVAMAAVVFGVVGIGVPSLLRAQSTAAPVDQVGDRHLVPWRAEPAPEPTNLARRTARADARDCSATDLNRQAWVGAERTAGDARTYTVLLPNISDSRCTLRGSGELVATDAATGRRGPLAMLHDGAADQVSQYPATIDPGEPARIDLRTTAACSRESKAATRYRDLALVVQGREFPISALEMTLKCPVGVGSWHVLPPLLNVPDIVASIEAPTSVRRGEALEYVVTLLNSGHRSYHFDPCPVFTQRLAGTAQTHRLQCADTAIDPQRSVRFQMLIPVPADAEPGRAVLSWMAVARNGKVIVADLATGGATIQII